MCKTGLSAPGTLAFRVAVCKSGLPAPGTLVFRVAVRKTGLSAPGISLLRALVCKSGFSAPGGAGQCAFRQGSPEEFACSEGLTANSSVLRYA